MDYHMAYKRVSSKRTISEQVRAILVLCSGIDLGQHPL